MTIHTPPPPEGGRIIDEPMETALSRRYLAYALSTITNRALPDVRDGFKPVHRRIMYAMHQMRLNPAAAARKCAKVVGEVMGTITRTVTPRSMTRWCGWRRTLRNAIRWSTGRGISATSTVITPRPCATPSAS